MDTVPFEGKGMKIMKVRNKGVWDERARMPAVDKICEQYRNKIFVLLEVLGHKILLTEFL